MLSLGATDIQTRDHGYDQPIAFDVGHIESGLEAYFIDTQEVEMLKFVISWIDLKEEDRDEEEMATYYGADPMLCDH